MAKTSDGKKTATKGGKPVKKEAKKREPVEKVPGLDIGLRSGKRVVETINDSLIQQRRVMYDDPRKMMSDDNLSQVWGKEFPQKESFQEVSSYRNYFNAGLAGMGDPPGQKLPEERRLYSKDRAMRMWAQGKYRPKCGVCPDKLKEQILKPKSKKSEE